MKIPFVIYGDLESILTEYNDPKITSTLEKYQKHEGFSIAFHLKYDCDDPLSKFRMYPGTDYAVWFAKELENIAYEVNHIIYNPVPMEKLTPQQQFDFYNSTPCHICKKR